VLHPLQLRRSRRQQKQYANEERHRRHVRVAELTATALLEEKRERDTRLEEVLDLDR
jgi:hypothetical protein